MKTKNILLSVLGKDANQVQILEENLIGKKGMNYFNLDVSTIQTGLYILKVTANGSSTFHKINVVNR